MHVAGEVALIRNQKLCRINETGYIFVAGDHFAVISDAVAKWKGGYIPTPAEEAQVSQRTALCSLRAMLIHAEDALHI